jgi:hypothetical protein
VEAPAAAPAAGGTNQAGPGVPTGVTSPNLLRAGALDVST